MGKIGRLEEDAVDQGKDGGVGADSHGQREDDHEGEDPVAEQAADGLTDFGWHARLLRSARGFGSRQFASGDAQAAVVGGPGAVAEEVRGGVVRNEAEKFARSGVVERKRDVVVRLFGRRMLQTIHLTVRTSKRPDVLVSREG